MPELTNGSTHQEKGLENKAIKTLIWPEHKEEITNSLESWARDKEICFRSLVTELTKTDDISLDQNGLPIIQKDLLASHAFRVGGWDKTKEVVSEHDSIAELVSYSEEGGPEVLSPLIWTSRDLPYVIETFNPRSKDTILAVIKPSPERVPLIRYDFTDDLMIEVKEAEDERFIQAVEEGKPFKIELPPFFIPEEEIQYIPGETLLGPFIMQDEIRALIKIRETDLRSFCDQARQVYSRSIENKNHPPYRQE